MGKQATWPGTDYPVRQKSAQGQPKPNTSIERRCHKCGASFMSTRRRPGPG